MNKQSQRLVHVADVDWAINELPNPAAELTLAIRCGEHPTFRLAFIARQRETDPRGCWNWCKVCNVEIPVQRIGQRTAQCASCFRHFEVVHEGTTENERLRADPNYNGPYHNFFSAIWHKWSLRPLRGETMPDGALAYDVAPFELPTRMVENGTRRVSRRERRLIARRSAGVPGRRGSKPVPTHVPTWKEEPFEPEYVRGLKTVKQERVTDSGFPRELSYGAELVEYRRTQHGYAARICEYCRCEVRVLATVYLEHSAPHLEALIQQGVQRAAVRLGTYAMGQELCFCAMGCSRPLNRALGAL